MATPQHRHPRSESRELPVDQVLRRARQHPPRGEHEIDDLTDAEADAFLDEGFDALENAFCVALKRDVRETLRQRKRPRTSLNRISDNPSVWQFRNTAVDVRGPIGGDGRESAWSWISPGQRPRWLRNLPFESNPESNGSPSSPRLTGPDDAAHLDSCGISVRQLLLSLWRSDQVLASTGSQMTTFDTQWTMR